MVKEKIPTIVGVLLVATVILVGIAIINNFRLKKTSTEENIVPKDVRVSNITESSFNVSWVTNTKIEGSVNWNNSSSNLKNNRDDFVKYPSYTHSVKIDNLTPSTDYYFNIISNERAFNNNGTPWQLKTAPEKIARSHSEVISGSVLDEYNFPATNALVYVTVGGSSLLSTTTSSSGSWILSISDSRTQNLKDYITIDENNTLIEIFVQAGPSGNASAQIYPVSAKPVPSITLGKTHIYKTINLKPERSPKAEINLPEVDLQTPGFSTEQ